MKVLIQSTRTKKFYVGDGRWSPKRAQATDFVTSIRAEHLAVQDKLQEVSLMLTFNTGRSRILIPLNLVA